MLKESTLEPRETTQQALLSTKVNFKGEIRKEDDSVSVKKSDPSAITIDLNEGPEDEEEEIRRLDSPTLRERAALGVLLAMRKGSKEANVNGNGQKMSEKKLQFYNYTMIDSNSAEFKKRTTVLDRPFMLDISKGNEATRQANDPSSPLKRGSMKSARPKSLLASPTP